MILNTLWGCLDAGKGLGFYTGDDGYLYCDTMRVEDCRQQHLSALEDAGLPQQPMYLYSKAKLEANYRAYQDAMEDLPYIVGYAVKANNNLPIMKHLQSLGSGAVLVSGNELKLAQAAGFDTTKCCPPSQHVSPQHPLRLGLLLRICHTVALTMGAVPAIERAGSVQPPPARLRGGRLPARTNRGRPCAGRS